MLGIEEEIINSIEEIDNTFSSINRTLREILAIVDDIGEKDEEIVENCAPWLRLFEVDSGTAEGRDIGSYTEGSAEARHSEYVESSLMMKFSSPRNPFIDNTSSEIINKTLLGDLDRKFNSNLGCSSTSSNIPILRPELETFESDSSVLLPFNIEDIPPSFRNEKELFMLYEFIAAGDGVSHEEISGRLPELPPEKLSIFIELLLRKRYIGKKKNRFTTY
jgi:hypothetical protein